MDSSETPDVDDTSEEPDVGTLEPYGRDFRESLVGLGATLRQEAMALRELPADLKAILLLTILNVVAVTVPVVRATPLRIALGLPFVLFAPGYVAVSALFPERNEPETSGDSDESMTGIVTRGGSLDGLERVGLSFGLSIIISPVLGLAVHFSGLGITLFSTLVSIGGFILLATTVAARRRWAVPPERRFRVRFGQRYASLRSMVTEADTGIDLALNVLLILSVLFATLTVAYAVGVPMRGEAFTEFYIVTSNSDGELVADGYPSSLSIDETASVVAGIENQEHHPMNYTVVVELHRVNSDRIVIAKREVMRFRKTLAYNETGTERVPITPQWAGERQRVVFLLYRDDPPQNPSMENAYRDTHLWINATS